MLAIGVLVRVLPPFSESWPGQYVIDGLSETGAWTIQGVDFDPAYLEAI